VALGFADIQVYNPQTDTWEASFDVGSTLTPVPRSCGDGGRAVYLRGEFFLIGGSTTDASVPTGTESRVDVYHPVTNSWRSEAELSFPRFGHDPVLVDRQIWVIAGGEDVFFPAGSSLETFHR